MSEKFKFDVIIGNPPYQEETRDTSDKPIYHLFMEEAYKIANKVIFITPARFLFNAGKTPKTWNEKMLNDEHLKIMYFTQNSAEVFPNTDIKGGLAVSYRDTKRNFGAIDVFTHFEELNTILKKVVSNNFEPLSDGITLQNKFNLDILYSDFPELKQIIGSDGKEQRLTTAAFEQLSVFNDEKKSDTDIQILGLVKNKRLYKWLNRKYLQEYGNIDSYKVLVPKANGSGAIGEVLSTPLIGEPLIGFTQSFISLGTFDQENDAKNMIKYIKSKFARVMLGILKITQDNSKATWRKVPLQDFTNQSDIDWTKSIPEIDQQLYLKYGLDEREIAFIEKKVKAMN